ncbi:MULTISPECIES: hypothetical protein [unclassified Microcoleus]|uniref:hypothetical protein n=1 Tax=unclassified Microcoleus TaxID=2642155 RepID=UPI002FD5AE5D
MGRLAFLVGYKGQDPSEKPTDATLESLIGTFTCTSRVAGFLGIVDKQYVPSGEANRDRKGYTKSVLNAAGVATDVVVPAGKISYTPDASARARTVILKTGALAKKTKRTVSLTFPSAMTVAQIGEALAEYIPDGKVQRTGTAPSATEIYPQYTIKGGRTYPLPLSATAETSTSVDAPSTTAEQAALLAKAK